jgi:hypothetical protein
MNRPWMVHTLKDDDDDDDDDDLFTEITIEYAIWQ